MFNEEEVYNRLSKHGFEVVNSIEDAVAAIKSEQADGISDDFLISYYDILIQINDKMTTAAESFSSIFAKRGIIVE